MIQTPGKRCRHGRARNCSARSRHGRHHYLPPRQQRLNMPDIPYRARRFNANPPTGKVHAPAPGMNWSGSVAVASVLDVATYGIGMGVLPGYGGARPWTELIWRAAMVLSSLNVQGGYFCRSASYDRLDGSEKSAISYFLGMTQCSMMADQVLGVRASVHVDGLLDLLGLPRTNRSRPDLVGYSLPAPVPAVGGGRFFLEAKGRTDGFSGQVVADALAQAQNPPPQVARLVAPNPIYVASLSYFSSAGRRWLSHLEDPPPPERGRGEGLQMSDAVFQGVVAICQLLPVRRAMRSLADVAPEFAPEERDGFTVCALPVDGLSVALPTPLLPILDRIDGPLADAGQREEAAREVQARVVEGNYRYRVQQHLDLEAERGSALDSGLALVQSMRREL